MTYWYEVGRCSTCEPEPGEKCQCCEPADMAPFLAEMRRKAEQLTKRLTAEGKPRGPWPWVYRERSE